MPISRRDWIRFTALASAMVASGCDDGDTTETPLDAGFEPDARFDSDAGPDAGSELDMEADADPDAQADMGPTGDMALGPDEGMWRHGVASGDPLSDAIIIWTRVSLDDPPAGPIDVNWWITTDPEMDDLVAEGVFSTSADRDFTVKVDVDGLSPDTVYYYSFQADETNSPVGRFRTTPADSIDHIQLAVVSCSALAHGYFHVYRTLAETESLHAIIHLGDYIYEHGDGQYGGMRAYDPPHEIITLEDYRRRYAHYHRDLDLQAAHQAHAFIAVWDDHELANNAWNGGAGNHQRGEGSWAVRKAAARQAYLEWMPIREVAPHLYRRIDFGDLVQLLMLDTRVEGRDQPPQTQEGRFDPDRRMLGADQEQWLHDALRDPMRPQWSLLGQQVMMGQLQPIGRPLAEGGGTAINLDQWDGYVAERDRFFSLLRAEQLPNVVVLTGDIHTSWAIDLTEDPNNPDHYDPVTGDGALAVEFVTPSITSPGLAAVQPSLLDFLKLQNPHIKFADVTRKGHIILDITPERIQATWWLIDSIGPDPVEPEVGAIYSVYDGEPKLVDESE